MARFDPTRSRYPFPSYPRGWFAVAFSHEVGEGDVLTRQAFGEELVLFRDGEGKVAVLHPHCPHMGAHLGRGGCVEDGAIRCPFHGMRFDGTGACVSIPGEVKIPPAMKTPAWEAREVDGAVLVWHDPAGAPPSFEPPAYFELRGSEGWTEM